jgi:hypothetical protein
MPVTPADAPILRIGARELLIDQNDQVLLIRARDPTDPTNTGRNYPAAERPRGALVEDGCLYIIFIRMGRSALVDDRFLDAQWS